MNSASVANVAAVCWNVEGGNADRGVPVVVRHRAWWAIAASLGVHLLGAVAVVGSSLRRGWPAAPVDVEITAMRLEDLQDLPLGAPASGESRPNAVVAPLPGAAPPARADRAKPDPDRPKPRPKLDRPRRPPVVEPDLTGGGAPPRPTSVRSYAPQGSRVTALMRIDRLRGTPYASAVDALLLNLPDRRDLLEGTGVDLYADIDAVLIATPNPLDPRVTFLAARHRLSDAAIRAALDRGAAATNRKLTWHTERGRPFAERRPTGPATAIDVPGRRDHRLILLPAQHLVVVTPPAYRALILGGGAAGRRLTDGGQQTPDGGTAAVTTTDGHGPTGAAGQHAPAAEDERDSWAALLRRIDAEDSIMPADAVAMVSASDLFSARAVRSTLDVAPGTRGGVDDFAAAAPVGPTIMGLPVPRTITATLGITPEPFVDIDADFASKREAVRWEQDWPALRHRILSNPLVVLSGFSGLIGRITLERTGVGVADAGADTGGGHLHMHLDATPLETTRILQMLSMQLGSWRP